MSRKYSSWAINQSPINADMSMMRLATVGGNEQDHLKRIERVEAIPHMYINVDAPPPPTTRIDPRLMQSAMPSQQMTSFFAAPALQSIPSNAQMKVWPSEKSVKDQFTSDNISSTSKRPHKHKHHHHHHRHHGDKHHHHRHQSQSRRAKSAESIRNRPNQRIGSPSSKMIFANQQYIEQDQQQQQQQQQPMIVYREVPNGEGYTVDTNSLATVPYDTQTEGGFVDDQQTPMFVYRDGNFQQQPQQIVTEAMHQPVFINQDQDTNTNNQNVSLSLVQNKIVSHRVSPLAEMKVNGCSPLVCSQPRIPMRTCAPVNPGCIQEIERIYLEEDQCCLAPVTNCVTCSCVVQQADPMLYVPQQQQSQIVYCSDPNYNHQEYLVEPSGNVIQQTMNPVGQQQFVCLDNGSAGMQPTIINQMPVFSSLSGNTSSPSIISLPQAQLQRTASIMIPQNQAQAQPLQIIQPSQPLQVIQQPQPIQVVQQPQPIQVVQQPQPFQIIQSSQPGQILQIAPAPQQVLQSAPVLQTIQASPQVLYQRPYDPVAIPVQNQQVAVAASPQAVISQPSYAPSRIISTTQAPQSHEPNMFRHALIRTVAGRSGVPIPAAAMSVGGGQQLIPSTVGTSLGANTNLVTPGGGHGSASLPIVPLTPGGLLIPFKPSQAQGFRPGPLPRTGGYSTHLQGFNDIRQQMQQRRDQLNERFQQERQRNYNRVPSPPVLSTASRAQNRPYTAGNIYTSNTRPAGYSMPAQGSTYARAPLPGSNYTQPSFANSPSGSVLSAPFNTSYSVLK